MNRCQRLCSSVLLALVALTTMGCDEQNEAEIQSLDIVVHAVSDDVHISCSAPFSLQDDQDPQMYLKDLRMFIHDVELKNAAGDWIPFQLTADDEWSDGRVTLLDFEDGGARCNESGNLFMNHQFSGTIAAGEYRGIRFRMGVPHELNHQDVTMANAPLNTSSMFWVWQKGYKFIRFEMVQDDGENTTPWMLHLN